MVAEVFGEKVRRYAKTAGKLCLPTIGLLSEDPQVNGLRGIEEVVDAAKRTALICYFGLTC